MIIETIEQTLKDIVTLTGISEQDYVTLQSVAPQTQRWADDIARMFYDTLFGYGPTAQIFKEDERFVREITIRNWYLQVISGELDEKFWQHQWTVGITHISRTINNSFMLSMMSRVQQLFLEKCLQEFEPAQAERVYGAFKRVTDVVAGLIAEGYHITYVEATENVGALLRSIIERKIEMEVKQKIMQIREYHNE